MRMQRRGRGQRRCCTSSWATQGTFVVSCKRHSTTACVWQRRLLPLRPPCQAALGVGGPLFTIRKRRRRHVPALELRALHGRRRRGGNRQGVKKTTKKRHQPPRLQRPQPNTRRCPLSQVQGIPTSFLSPSLLPPPAPRFRLLLAGGVVPAQHALWLQRCPDAYTVDTHAVLPGGTYPGLGVDRALALRGAGEGEDGWPCLVVDVGTALTFTAGDAKGGCGGGAIVPGLRLALQSLATRTALLPEMPLPRMGEAMPPKFASATGEAIQAGVLHSVRSAMCVCARGMNGCTPAVLTVFNHRETGARHDPRVRGRVFGGGLGA